MTQLFVLICSLFIATGSINAQTIFVSADASGTNDGTSWNNAYTSLDDALNTVNTGQSIWVKAGVYLPNITFTISQEINLLGGFSGTETNANESDPATNLTILSGDLNNDDNPDQLTSNRSDNVRILAITEGTGNVTIDGFTFVGGQLDPVPDDTNLDQFSGAAILTFSPVTINRCTFTANAADYGAAISMIGIGVDQANISNLMVSNNLSSGNGVIYSSGASNVSIATSTFQNNETDRGSVYFEDCENISVTSSIFNNNTSDRGPGVYLSSSTPAYIGNTEFTENSSTYVGGAILLSSSDSDNRPADPEDYVIDNCRFTENTSVRFGGSILIDRANSTIRNSLFINNGVSSKFSNRGGAIAYFNGNYKRMNVIDSCEFTGNQAMSTGSAIYLQGKTNFDVVNSLFQNNGASTDSRRGAISYIGNFDDSDDAPPFIGIFNVINSLFTGNQASLNAGAIFVSSFIGNIEFNVLSSTFESNAAYGVEDEGWGGAIMIDEGVISSFDDCIFQSNEAIFGGAIFLREKEIGSLFPRDTAKFDLTNCKFTQNIALRSGGAIYSNKAPTKVTNSVFAANLAENGGGGAIMIDYNESSSGDNSLVNNTFYGNFAGAEAFAPGDLYAIQRDDAAMSLTIQNNAFTSVGGLGNFDFVGPIDLTSLGGNYYVQQPSSSIPFAITDIFQAPDETIVLYQDPNDNLDPEGRDFHLANPINNPLVNSGTNGPLVPITDHDGNERNEVPDIGAYETGLAAEQTVMDVIATTGIHTNLTTLLNQTNLDNTLRGEGPFTVFAPTDAAFTNLSQEALDLLNIEDYLTNILLTHVVSGAIPSSAVTDGLVIPSLAPMTNLEFTNDGVGTITVTTAQSAIATVTVADLMGSNGIVHVIDVVLVPAIVAVTNFDGAGIDVEFFPNPVQDQMNIRIDDASIMDMNVSVINVNGQRVSNWSLGNGNNLIDFSRVPAGTYTLEIHLNGETYSKQVMKQ